MDDPTHPNPAMDALPPSAAALAQLYRMVERLVDADYLLAEDGGALLVEIAAARGALDAGDVAAAHGHTRQFCEALEALVRSDLIEEAHGRSALAAARRMLGDPAG
jgi:hypothetical protein